MGGVEYLNGEAQFLSHSDGRVVFDANALHFQYKISDHLGNTVVLFEDKDQDGIILPEQEISNPEDQEVLQRNLYYPFGMELDGTWSQSTLPEMRCLYNLPD